jgi:hypothetical protein
MDIHETLKTVIANKLQEISGKSVVIGKTTFDPYTFTPYALITIDGVTTKNVLYNPERVEDFIYVAHFDQPKPIGDPVDHVVPKFGPIKEYVAFLWAEIQKELIQETNG